MVKNNTICFPAFKLTHLIKSFQCVKFTQPTQRRHYEKTCSFISATTKTAFFSYHRHRCVLKGKADNNFFSLSLVIRVLTPNSKFFEMTLCHLGVPRAGLEPARPKPRDFKSLVVTNFTIGAMLKTFNLYKERLST